MFCAEIFCHSFENFAIVCVDCDLKTNHFSEFVNHYQKEHCEFQPKIKTNASKLDSPVKSAVKQKHHQLEDENVHPIRNLVEERILENSVEENPLESAKFSCPICPKLYVNKLLLQKHLHRHHANETNIEETDTNPTLDTTPSTHTNDKLINFEIEVMLKDFESSDLIEQATNEFEQDAIGNQRDETLSANTNHKREKLPVVEDTYKFQCTYCGREYKKRNGLTGHLRLVHDVEDTGSYPCTQCEQVFPSGFKLKCHLIRHTGQRNFKCDEPGCNASFYDSIAVGSHKRSVHKRLRNLLCDICGFSSKRPSKLRDHLRTHTGDKPFKCEQCEKFFRTMNGLSQHKIIHASNILRPHVCGVCGTSFRLSKSLYHHKFLHEVVNKFVCKICGKSYKQQSGLSAHKRQHACEKNMEI